MSVGPKVPVRILPCLFQLLWWLSAFLGLEMHRPSFCLRLHMAIFPVFLCLDVSVTKPPSPFLYKDTTHN